MTRATWGCLVVALFLQCAARVEAAAAFPRPEITAYELPNGLKVIYLGMHEAPVVTVQVWYHVGSRDEPRDRRGSAHMFEHMMFKGTKHVPDLGHARMVDRLGGYENAFTKEDTTAYFEVLPSHLMDFAMLLEAERMQNLLFRKEMVDTEREVVKEEIRSLDAQPIVKAIRTFRALAFTRHPYGWHPGGYIEDLDNTVTADLERFYRLYYQPNNAYLVVVGDVTEADVRASALRHFGSIPRVADPPRPSKEFPEPEQTELRRATVEPSQLGILIGGYKIPPSRHADRIPIEIVRSIMSEGESSRLYQRLIRRDKVAVAAGLVLQQFEDPGLLLVYGAFLMPDQALKIEAGLFEEVARVQTAKVAAEELQKAKNQLLAKFVFELQEVEGVAHQIGMSLITTGDPRDWLNDYERILAVTAEDVQRVAKAYLTKERLTLVVIPPGGGPPGGESPASPKAGAKEGAR